MANVTIQLENPIKGHGGEITEVTMRAPGFREIMKYGDPYLRGTSQDGRTIVHSENMEALHSYITDCLVISGGKGAQIDASLINQLSLIDTLRLTNGMLDFFLQARKRLADESESSDPSKASAAPSTS